MCYNPLHLPNPSYGYARHIDQDGVIYKGKSRCCNDVPCGKCEACRQQRTDAYILRCQTEFAKCNHRALFVTLTYADEHLPSYTYHIDPVFEPEFETSPRGGFILRHGDVLEDIKFNTISCWNKLHLQKFLKAYNEKLIYYIGTHVKGLKRLVTIGGHRQISPEWKLFLNEMRGNNPLKYLVVCERGHSDIYTDDNGRTRTGTSRPHYHAILFIEDIRLSMAYCLKLVHDLWKYGRSYNIQITSRKCFSDESFSHRDALDRSFSNSIEYVCKYVNKDYYDIIEKCYFYSHDDALTYRPFMLISRGLGASLFDNYSQDDTVREYVNGHSIPSGSSSTGTRNIAITSYYADKVGIKTTIRSKSTKPYPVEFLQEYSVAQPIFAPSDLYEYAECIKSESYTTSFGALVNSKLAENKAKHYSELLTFVHTSMPVNSHLNLDACLMVSPEKLHDYILNLYCDGDNSKYGDLEYVVYCSLRDYETFLSKQKRHEHEIAYKNNIYKAIEKNPSLFNLKPLEYEN